MNNNAQEPSPGEGDSQREHTAPADRPEQEWRGWWWPPHQRKAHYFTSEDGGISLCRKYWSFIPNVVQREVEDKFDNSPDNCAACKKLVSKIRDKEINSALSRAERTTLPTGGID